MPKSAVIALKPGNSYWHGPPVKVILKSFGDNSMTVDACIGGGAMLLAYCFIEVLDLGFLEAHNQSSVNLEKQYLYSLTYYSNI